MWQWYIQLPGRSSGIQAMRTVLRGARFTTSSHERKAGALPSTDRTWKKKPCRWKGWSISELFTTSHTCNSPTFTGSS